MPLEYVFDDSVDRCVLGAATPMTQGVDNMQNFVLLVCCIRIPKAGGKQ